MATYFTPPRSAHSSSRNNEDGSISALLSPWTALPPKSRAHGIKFRQNAYTRWHVQSPRQSRFVFNFKAARDVEPEVNILQIRQARRFSKAKVSLFVFCEAAAMLQNQGRLPFLVRRNSGHSRWRSGIHTTGIADRRRDCNSTPLLFQSLHKPCRVERI